MKTLAKIKNFLECCETQNSFSVLIERKLLIVCGRIVCNYTNCCHALLKKRQGLFKKAWFSDSQGARKQGLVTGTICFRVQSASNLHRRRWARWAKRFSFKLKKSCSHAWCANKRYFTWRLKEYCFVINFPAYSQIVISQLDNQKYFSRYFWILEHVILWISNSAFQIAWL